MEIEQNQVKKVIQAAKKNLPILIPLLPFKGKQRFFILLGMALAKQINKNKQIVFYK